MSPEEKKKSKIDPHSFLGLLGCLSAALLMTITFAWIFYAEGDLVYEFWKLSISRSGGIWIWDGDVIDRANHTSQLLFTVGVGFCSGICFILFVLALIEYRRGNQPIFNFIIFGIMSIGAGLIAIPRDHETLHVLHYVGVALFIIGFGIFNGVSQLYRRGRRRISAKANKIDFVMVWIVIGLSLLYAIGLIIDIVFQIDNLYLSIFNAISQKSVVLVCIFAIWVLDEEDIGLPQIPKEEDPGHGKYLAKQIFMNGWFKQIKQENLEKVN